MDYKSIRNIKISLPSDFKSMKLGTFLVDPLGRTGCIKIERCLFLGALHVTSRTKSRTTVPSRWPSYLRNFHLWRLIEKISQTVLVDTISIVFLCLQSGTDYVCDHILKRTSWRICFRWKTNVSRSLDTGLQGSKLESSVRSVSARSDDATVVLCRRQERYSPHVHWTGIPFIPRIQLRSDDGFSWSCTALSRLSYRTSRPVWTSWWGHYWLSGRDNRASPRQTGAELEHILVTIDHQSFGFHDADHS